MNPETRNKIILLIVFLAAFDIFVWRLIVFGQDVTRPEIYFLDVGQGDSELIVLPGGVKILIDGGPSRERLISRLEEILPQGSRYFDLVVLSHSQADHSTGLIKIFKRYQIGIFISNGISGSAKSYRELDEIIGEKSISKINLAAGDRIRYKEYLIEVLSPSTDFLKRADLNEGSLVLSFKADSATVLFTGDIGFKAENQLIRNYPLDIDILKVAHHGSKYASGADFLRAATPEISVISVGRNSYGHPTKETLWRLQSAGSQVYRTDRDGTLKLVIDGRRISVFKRINLE